MLFIRSLLFQIAFYLNNIIQVIIFMIPFLMMSREKAWSICRFWGRSHMWLHAKIIGTELEVRGAEHIPEGGFIVAAKHQSSYETLSLYNLFAEPTYILKAGLLKVPLLGVYFSRMDMIGVNRGRGGSTLKSMAEGVDDALNKERQIIIFPEGTRRYMGDDPRNKYGIRHLYETLDVTVLPVSLNTGAFWPKNRFLHYPGKVIFQIHPPINQGLEGDEFMDTLMETIETGSNALLLETAAADNASPVAVNAATKLG